MSETDFISLIDCAIPYDKPVVWKRLVTLAPRISSNTAFMVVHEVCRVPLSRAISRAQSENILKHLFRRFRHPALRVLRPAIEAYLEGTSLRSVQASALMRRVAPYRNEYNALALCYFSAQDTERGDMERTYQSIVSEWKAKEAAQNEA
jgi:hypothetical protein